MIKKSLLTIIILLITVYNLTVIYVDNNIDKKNNTNVYNSAHKIWAARGLYKTHEEQNSITAIDNAFDHGTLGVEVDFHYDVETNRFIVSHDYPKLSQNGKLIYTTKDGEILTLEKLFVQTGKDHFYWLDYKNLDKLNKKQTLQAIKRLQEITLFDSIKQRVYIEGSNPLILSKYTDAGFHTILGIHPLPQSNIFSSILINLYKIAYYYKNITALAMPYGSIENPIYGAKTEKNLKTVPLFLFHTPDDENLLYSLVKKDDVRVILVGRDISVNRYYINSLTQKEKH